MNKFNDIVMKKESLREERRKQRKTRKKHKQTQNPKSRISILSHEQSIKSLKSQPHNPSNPLLPKIKSKTRKTSPGVIKDEDDEYDVEQEQKYDDQSRITGSLNIESCHSQTLSAHGTNHGNLDMIHTTTVTQKSYQKTLSGTAMSQGSVNSVITNSGKIFKGEIKRMRKLIIGLGFCIVVFMLNAGFNIFRANQGWYKYFGLEGTDIDELFDNIYVVSFIFFPQWTVINVFVMMFSWIPRSQLKDEYDE